MTLSAFHNRRLLKVAAVLALLLTAGVLQLADANPAASQVITLKAWEARKDPGLDPSSEQWKDVLPVQVPLTAQGAAYPTGGGSVPVAWARALYYEDTVYVRVEWDDATKDESTTRVEDFADGVAIEFPAKSASSVPSICMGQADGGVNIWHWRADSQAGLVDPADVYTAASVDLYPVKEDLFYTARAAGNPFSDTSLGPVQTLVAQAFGTLARASVQDVTGQGVYEGGRWSVVFARQLSGADDTQATFSPGVQTDMAIAVWNGSQGDRNGRKSLSQFIALGLADSPPASALASDPSSTPLFFAGALLVLFVGMGTSLGIYGYREARRSP